MMNWFGAWLKFPTIAFVVGTIMFLVGLFMWMGAIYAREADWHVWVAMVATLCLTLMW